MRSHSVWIRSVSELTVSPWCRLAWWGGAPVNLIKFYAQAGGGGGWTQLGLSHSWLGIRWMKCPFTSQSVTGNLC